MEQENKNWYDRYYKLMILPPVILLAVCLVYLGYFYSQTGEFINKDSSLSGGTTITLQGDIDSKALENSLRANFPDIYIRQINEIGSGRVIATIVDSSATPEELEKAIENALGYELDEKNSSIEFTGPSLGSNFYRQLITALIVSFILMSIVIFFLFRSFIPSAAVIFAAFADIVMPLAFVNAMGMKISAAGIAAFLMLIGYSVDTDILLTTRVLKKGEGSVNKRIYSSFKTGMFMTITALIAVSPALFVVTGLPESFRQIFFILFIGLLADIVNTWFTNASVIKWYAHKRGLR